MKTITTLTLLFCALSAYAEDEEDPYAYARQYGRQPSIFASPSNEDLQRQIYLQQQQILRQQRQMESDLRYQRMLERAGVFDRRHADD